MSERIHDSVPGGRKAAKRGRPKTERETASERALRLNGGCPKRLPSAPSFASIGRISAACEAPPSGGPSKPDRCGRLLESSGRSGFGVQSEFRPSGFFRAYSQPCPRRDASAAKVSGVPAARLKTRPESGHHVGRHAGLAERSSG